MGTVTAVNVWCSFVINVVHHTTVCQLLRLLLLLPLRLLLLLRLFLLLPLLFLLLFSSSSSLVSFRRSEVRSQLNIV
jgi:hypothetical protein